MKHKSAKQPVIIVGAGLSGLITATRIHAAGYTPLLLETRQRAGGRILSVSAQPKSSLAAKFDLGPAWVWPHHQHILQLLNVLDLQIYQQYEEGLAVYEQSFQTAPQLFKPDWEQPISYRIIGGVSALVDGLVAQLPEGAIDFNRTVTEIVQKENRVRLVVERSGSTEMYWAQQLIVTLPPHLAATTIRYQPTLPTAVLQVMKTTPTWMGMAMKVALVYDKPFWQKRGLSGFGVSAAGPVAQFHDATPYDRSVGALFGWIGDHSPSRKLPLSERKTAVVAQVVRMFGEEAASPLFYDELNWSQEAATTNLVNNPTTQGHPRYGHPLLQTAQMNGRLHWAVTEASSVNGGYLDGAVFIAQQVADRVLAQLENR